MHLLPRFSLCPRHLAAMAALWGTALAVAWPDDAQAASGEKAVSTPAQAPNTEIAPALEPLPAAQVFQRAPAAGLRAGADGEPHSAATLRDDDKPTTDDGSIQWRINDRRAAHRQSQLSLDAGIFVQVVSGGLWFSIPLVPKGLIGAINDSFDLEFGALLLAGRLWSGGADTLDLLPALGVRWNFHLTRRWTTFVGAKLGPRIHLLRPFDIWPDPVVTLGSLLTLNKALDLRLELNYPQGFVVGISMPLGGKR